MNTIVYIWSSSAGCISKYLHRCLSERSNRQQPICKLLSYSISCRNSDCDVDQPQINGRAVAGALRSARYASTSIG